MSKERKMYANNTSGYRGVGFYKRNGRWRAQISVDKKVIHIGFFKRAIGAARAYDRYVIENGLDRAINGVL